MVQLITPSDYSKLTAIFQPLKEHLAIESALSGKSSARIYADSPDDPQSALIWMRQRIYLAGAAKNPEVVNGFGDLFREIIIPNNLQVGIDILILNYSPESWEDQVGDLLPGVSSTRYWRQYYRLKQAGRDWRESLPDGFALRLVDQELLNDKSLKHLSELKEEMCSERDSVAEFLEKSFGVCLVFKDELEGWCLSEYNLEGRCEIGIAVQEAYRKRGLATLMTIAFVEEAQRRGIEEIGWDCWKENHPSVATAIKAGFELVKEYPVYFFILDRKSW